MESLFSVRNKVIMVSGASSGLGRHFAYTLAKFGAKVAMGARRIDRLKAIEADIAEQNSHALALPLDVTRPDSIERFVENVEKQLGPINVLINNAGVDARGDLFHTEEADWSRVIDTNLWGLVQVTKAVAARMKAHKKSGSIINISSVSDALAFKGGNPPYMISKAGVAHFTHLLALELAPEIRANTIAPGVYRTEINDDLFGTDVEDRVRAKVPMARLGQLQDLDGALLLLCSDASQYMTGTTLRVDGGLGINKLG